jgi:transketolase
VRDSFVRALELLAEQEPRLLLLTGDLGFGVLNNYTRRYPKQFANVGVAEQNLAGVGAGLAMAGHVVYTYSIGNFPTLRCLEQIRNDICYHGARVRIVTVGGGLAYGALGPSHFATEDLAIMRALPGITVVAPGDPVEVELLLPQIHALPGPAYVRLGRAGERKIHPAGTAITLGVPTRVRAGHDVLLLSTGGMLPVAVDAATLLESDGVSTEILSVHTLKPLDTRSIIAAVRRASVVVTCEEHSVIGGLGGAIAETLMEAGVSVPFKRFGLNGCFPEGIGSQEYLRAINGLDAVALRSTVLALSRSRASSFEVV